ncbi:MAG: ribbon-helix-helix domain-containing protein [Methanosarcinales archaeon]
MEYKLAKHYLLDDQINGLIETGYYPNRSELIMDALRYLFSKRRDLRLASAIELYQEEKVTLSRQLAQSIFVFLFVPLHT